MAKTCRRRPSDDRAYGAAATKTCRQAAPSTAALLRLQGTSGWDAGADDGDGINSLGVLRSRWPSLCGFNGLVAICAHLLSPTVAMADASTKRCLRRLLPSPVLCEVA